MDDNGRDTSKAHIEHHKNGFKTFVNNLESFDNKKFEDYVKEYCENDDNFENVDIKAKEDKPKRKLSPEHLAKMQEGRRKKAEEKKAAALAAAGGGDAAENDEESEKEESEKEEEKPKPKARKPKAAAH
jgi:hypothetical protein